MLKLEYVGEKPVISSHGVSFDVRKQDKYEFVEPAAHILQMFLNLDDNNKAEKLEPSEVYGEEKILLILRKARPNFNKFYETEIDNYKNSLDEEIENVKNQHALGDREKETLKKNYEFMRKYRVQRATNKIVYEEIINACVDIIKEKKITEVKAPFSSTFLHVLGSLRTTMELERVAKGNVEFKLDTDNPYSQLDVTF